MAHRSSSASLHAARVVLKNFTLTPRPPETLPSGAVRNLTNSEAHVSILIDKVSGAHEIAKLRPELRDMQERLAYGTATAPQVQYFVRRVLTAFENVPKDPPVEERKKANAFLPRELPVAIQNKWREAYVSQAALLSMRTIWFYFDVDPVKERSTRDEARLRLEMARYIDVSLALNEALKALPLLRKCEQGLAKGNLTENEVRQIFLDVGICLERLPTYSEREEETKLLV